MPSPAAKDCRSHGDPIEELDSFAASVADSHPAKDAPIHGDEGRSSLGDWMANPASQEPLELLERAMHLDQLEAWLASVGGRSARC